MNVAVSQAGCSFTTFCCSIDSIVTLAVAFGFSRKIATGGQDLWMTVCQSLSVV